MDWCQILEILNALARPLLVLVTLGLVAANVLLYLSTRRYSKAMEQLLKMEQLGFADRLFEQISPAPLIAKTERIDIIAGIDDKSSQDVRQVKKAEWQAKVQKAYGKSVRQVLDNILKE